MYYLGNPNYDDNRNSLRTQRLRNQLLPDTNQASHDNQIANDGEYSPTRPSTVQRLNEPSAALRHAIHDLMNYQVQAWYLISI